MSLTYSLVPMLLATGASLIVTVTHAACSKAAQPVATVTMGLSRASAPLGGFLELDIRFDVSPTLATLPEDYGVFVHFLDGNDKLLWADDHAPPYPTSSWTPRQVVAYRHRIRVPMYPYIGEATVAIGLYSMTTGDRLTLAGENLGQQKYRVATLTLEPTPASWYDEGWHQTEYTSDGRVEWRWTTNRAVVSFRNPGTDATLFLDLDGRADLFEDPQQISIMVGDRTLHEFAVDTNDRTYRELCLRAADLGTSQTIKLELYVDQTFVPAEHGGSPTDDRELGVRVFHAFLEPR